MLPVQVVITVLCAVGFYASVFMLRKSVLARQGRLTEPSVVQTPRARLVAGMPNALIGIVYYAAMAAVSWSADRRALLAAVCAAAPAAATSLYLAYSLLFVTKRPCLYCFISHAVNVLLLALATLHLVL